MWRGRTLRPPAARRSSLPRPPAGESSASPVDTSCSHPLTHFRSPPRLGASPRETAVSNELVAIADTRELAGRQTGRDDIRKRVRSMSAWHSSAPEISTSRDRVREGHVRPWPIESTSACPNCGESDSGDQFAVRSVSWHSKEQRAPCHDPFGLRADFRAGEPARLTIRLADLVVTEWVLGCGSQLLSRAHELTTHLVLSLLYARSPAHGPTSSPPATTSYDTPPPPSQLHSTPSATSQPSLPSHLTCTPPSLILAARCVGDRCASWPPSSNRDDFIIRIIKPLSTAASTSFRRHKGCWVHAVSIHEHEATRAD